MKTTAILTWALLDKDGKYRIIARPSETRDALMKWADDDERVIRVEIRVIKKKGRQCTS